MMGMEQAMNLDIITIYNNYKAIYCGFCKEIKRRHRYIMILFSQYELIFLLLMIDSELNLLDSDKIAKGRCLFPFKKVKYIKGQKIFAHLADLLLIVIYTYLFDKKFDGDSFRVKHYLASKLIDRKIMNSRFNFNPDMRGELSKIFAQESDSNDTQEKNIKPVCELYSRIIVNELNLTRFTLNYL